MNAPAKILLIEDDRTLGAALFRVLTDTGHHVILEKDGNDGLSRARQEVFEVVITDLKLPGRSGLELVNEIHKIKPRLPIILMTAHGSTETAIEATKQGAFDYLLKPFDMPELIELTSKAVACGRLMSEPVVLGGVSTTQDAMVGKCRALQGIYKEIGRVAAKPVSVLVRGETGTGKELIARAIYQHSDRCQTPFVPINCAAIPETLLESELFGHERGAFTGAESRRIGRFEQADKGTIFLDEIGDMSLMTQAKILRVLQEKCFQRLGGADLISVDVRMIAATHHDLETAIRQGQFREDLYYRLSVVVITLPPLRERKEDIPDLVDFFLGKYGSELGVSHPAILPEAVQLLQGQPWPGNVRELENVVRKLLLLAQDYTISPEHVRSVLNQRTPALHIPDVTMRSFVGQLLAAAQQGELSDAHDRLLEAAERELFSQAIDLAQGNQAKAARWLGVSRLTIREKLRRFGC